MPKHTCQKNNKNKLKITYILLIRIRYYSLLIHYESYNKIFTLRYLLISPLFLPKSGPRAHHAIGKGMAGEGVIQKETEIAVSSKVGLPQKT